jgi:hypothetical protein
MSVFTRVCRVEVLPEIFSGQQGELIMSSKRTAALMMALCLGLGGTAPAAADGNAPVGTWLLTITFPEAPPGAPPSPPPFQELISLHHNGTLTETNTTLHAHPIQGAPLAITASEGFGTWSRAPGGKVSFGFLKMVFCGPEFDPATFGLLSFGLGMAPPYDCSIPNLQLGYISVRSTASFRGDTYSGGESWTELLIGPDPEAPLAVLPFGPATSEGRRIRMD